MENIHKQFLDGLIESEKLWQTSDHLVYVTYPVVKDSKLLVRALENVYKSLVLLISEILKFEYLYKRVLLSRDSRRNLDIFFDKCSIRYGLSIHDKTKIREIMFLGKKHKDSGMEFSKEGKIIILDDNLGMTELTNEKIKEFLEIVKQLLKNTNRNFREIF